MKDISYITIKNSARQVCDYRPLYDVNIDEEIENISKLIEELRNKMIEITGIPKKYESNNHEDN